MGIVRNIDERWIYVRAKKQTVGLQRYQNGNQNPKSTGNQRKYLCLTDMFGGHSNRILTLARGKRMAIELGLSFALTNWQEYMMWYKRVLDPNPSAITLPSQHQRLNCVKNITSKNAYYNNFKNKRLGNPFVAELAKYFLPRKASRKNAAKPALDLYGEKAFLSVHRRQFPRCAWRATDGPYGRNVGGGAKCSKQTMLGHCDLTYEKVQQEYDQTKLPVLLFTDGRNTSLDESFPTKDDHDFFTQLWMMTLSERHVGVPVSTVDVVVNHWRYAAGKQFIEPAGCYNDFDEARAAMNPRHLAL